MNNIEEIMRMLDCGNEPSIQNKGIELAKSVTDIWLFIQPMNLGYNKYVWENCAIILSQKTDEELQPYLIPLLEWLQDINWPGAFIIYYRLLKIPARIIFNQYMYCVNRAIENKNQEWLNYISGIMQQKELARLLPEDYKDILNNAFNEFWGYEN